MPVDPTPYLEPSASAVVVFECQQMVIGEHGPYRGLVDSVRSSGMLDTLAGLLDDARSTGATVCYCTVFGRPGGLGAAKSPLNDRTRAAAPAAAAEVDRSIVPELAPKAGDVIVERSHGMSAFHGTELDSVLRDLGVGTVIPTGVSANIGIIGTAIEALNHGYRVVLAADCVAGDPPEYADQMMRYSFRNLGYVTSAAVIAEAWRSYK